MEKLIVGNLKMNLLSPLEREKYFELIKKEMQGKKLKNIRIILCPSHIHLESFKKISSKKIKIGAQNCFWETKGSFTGEVSPAMLKNFGCEYVLIGHSERKRYFCETDEEINYKMLATLNVGLKPILCVGETKLEKEANETLHVITRQVKTALTKINRAKAEQLTLAYEPVWAVGSDVVPTAHDIMEAKVLIKKILVDFFGKKYAEMVRILYGGSVNFKTVREVCLNPGMDGVLVGRESLAPHEFVKIAEIING